MDQRDFKRFQLYNIGMVHFRCMNGHTQYVPYQPESKPVDPAIFKKHFKNSVPRPCAFCHNLIESPSSPHQKYHQGECATKAQKFNEQQKKLQYLDGLFSKFG